MHQEVHVCVDGSVWKWCEPVSLARPGTLVRTVTSPDSTYTLIISLRQISNIQMQVGALGPQSEHV